MDDKNGCQQSGTSMLSTLLVETVVGRKFRDFASFITDREG